MADQLENQSNTPYDDAFRTMITKSGSLRIPFLNEMFQLEEPIPTDAYIEDSANEIYIEGGKGKQKKLITDSRLHVGNRTFHTECESGDDGTILVRMFEYDIHIGLQEHEFYNNHLIVRIPYSGVLFLRKSSEKSEPMTVTIEARGERLEYPVDTIYFSDYTLDDLIEKDLLFLFPFYMFNLEKEFKPFEENDEEAREKVICSLSELLQHVNDLFHSKKLTFENYLLVTDMLRKVTDHLTQKYETVRKELDNIMGGKIIEFKGETIFNEGRAEGEKAGEINSLVELVHDGELDFNVAARKAENKYGVTPGDFKAMVDNYQPKAELLQG